MRITMRSARRSEDGLSIYEVGTTQTVSTAYGSQAVQAGYATDTDGVLNLTAVSPLLVTPAQAAAFPGLVSGAGIFKTSARPKLTPYAVKHGGTLSVSGVGDLTRQAKIKLPTTATAIRVRIYHATTSAQTGIKAAFAFSNSASGVQPSGSWTTATFSGSGAVNIPAAPANGLVYVESDLMQVEPIPTTDGSAAILYLRTYQPASQLLSRFDFTDVPNYSVCGFEASFQTGVDGIASPAAFTSSTAVQNTTPVEIIVYGADGLPTVVMCGASTMAGYGDSTGNYGLGWAERAASQLGTFAVSTMASAGMSTLYSLPIAIADLAAKLPSAAIYMPVSPNDADIGTAAGLYRCISNISQWVEACRKYGVRCGLATLQRPNGISAAFDAQRNTINAISRAVCARGDAVLFDVDATLTNASGWINAAWTDDGTHANSPGQVILKTAMLPAFQTLLANINGGADALAASQSPNLVLPDLSNVTAGGGITKTGTTIAGTVAANQMVFSTPVPIPTANYQITLTVNSMSGSVKVLQEGGGTLLTISAPGTYSFKAQMPSGSLYLYDNSGAVNAVNVSGLSFQVAP